VANFFDAFSGRDITALRITKGSKFRIGLYGGAPGGVRLNVTTAGDAGDATTPDPAVKFLTEQGSWRLIYEVGSSRIQSNKVRACWNGSDYSAPVALTSVSAPGFGKADVRRSIVQLARTFVPSAHYLWGTAGNTPGNADGNAGGGKMSAALMRAFSLSQTEAARDKVLGVCMAVQSQFDGYNTCAGRSGRFSGPGRRRRKRPDGRRHPDQAGQYPHRHALQERTVVVRGPGREYGERSDRHRGLQPQGVGPLPHAGRVSKGLGVKAHDVVHPGSPVGSCRCETTADHRRNPDERA